MSATKRKFLVEKLISLSHNDLYKIMRAIKKEKKSNKSEEITFNDIKIENIEIFDALAKNLDWNPNCSLKLLDDNHTFLNSTYINTERVKNAITEMDLNKAPGIYEICPFMI